MRTFPLLLALAATLVPGLATAQIPTSTADRVTTPGQQTSKLIAMSDATLRETVRCIVDRQPDRARNLLGTVPGTRQERLILDSFQSRLDQCFPRLEGGISFPSVIMRGIIAEEVFVRDFPAGLPQAAPTSESIAAWYRLVHLEDEPAVAALVLESARCAVAKSPADAAQLVASTPLSAEERAALATLAPVVGDCVDQGVNFHFSRQMLRAALAQGLYAYAVAAMQGFPANEAALAVKEPSR